MRQLMFSTGVRSFGRMLFALCVLLAGKDALSQQASNVIATGAEFDMLLTPVGATVSRPAVVRNDRSSAITIKSVDLVCGSAPFHYLAAATLPLVVQPGDTVLLGSVSYTPYRTNEDFVGYLIVDHAPRLNSEDGEVRLRGSSTVDPSALKPCMTLALDSQVFGPVLYGGEVIRELKVRNNLDTARTVRCIDFTIQDRDAFSGGGKQFPMHVEPNSTGTILISFKPQGQKSNGSNDFMTDVLVEPMDVSDECQPDIRIHGVALVATPMSKIIPIDDTTSPIGMCSTEWQFAHDFTFQNQSQQEITITDASLQSENAAMSLASLCGAELPVTLAPGEKVSARVTYTAPNMDVHYDHLVFECENAAPRIFPVQALRLPASAVRNGLGRRQIALSIRPNPSTGTVVIDLEYGYKGDMAIYSTNGVLIDQKKDATSWTWKAPMRGSSAIASGEYTLRVTCHDIDGVTLTRSEKLIVLGQ
jgi:hypothetical protein